VERLVFRLADELTDRQVKKRGIQIVLYKIIDESDVHGGRGGLSGWREDLLSFFHEEIRRNQLIEANYEQFVFPTDAFWSLLGIRSVFDRKRFIYLLWQLSSNCHCVQSR